MSHLELIGSALVHQITESTPITHRPLSTDNSIDTMLSIGPFDLPHTNQTAGRVMEKLIREWVRAGWGDDAAEILAEEMSKVDGAPESFPAVLGRPA